MEKDKKTKKYELLAEHIVMFKKAFKSYIGNYESLNREYSCPGGEEDCGTETCGPNGIFNGNPGKEPMKALFEELVSNYYMTVIASLKKLAAHDRTHINALIETCEEFWKSAPRTEDKDYLSPQLLNLCMFLYKMKETEYLSFFYNLLIYCREIPFLSPGGAPENYLGELHDENNGGDPVGEFRAERLERLLNGFDAGLCREAYDKFLLILAGWRGKTDGYYTKDETAFMSGLFVLDELIDYVFFEGETGAGQKDKDKNKEKFIRLEAETEGRIMYESVDGARTMEKMSAYYEKALGHFERAIRLNPNNPRYYYEYARCLKNSGKSKEAEIFFKKAFDINTEVPDSKT